MAPLVARISVARIARVGMAGSLLNFLTFDRLLDNRLKGPPLLALSASVGTANGLNVRVYGGLLDDFRRTTMARLVQHRPDHNWIGLNQFFEVLQ